LEKKGGEEGAVTMRGVSGIHPSMRDRKKVRKETGGQNKQKSTGRAEDVRKGGGGEHGTTVQKQNG